MRKFTAGFVAPKFRSGMKNGSDPIAFGVERLPFQLIQRGTCQENAAAGKEGICSQSELCFHDCMNGLGLCPCARGIVEVLVPCHPEVVAYQKQMVNQL
jgi:hypothetical protein